MTENDASHALALALDLSEKPPWPLFHYCDASALLGILRGKEIWSTQIGHLNDATELSAAEEIARKVLLDLLGTTPPSAASEALDWLAKIYNPSRPSQKHDHYVFSLSEQGDLLSQWRGYAADGGGFAVGFGSIPLVPRHWPDSLDRDVGVQIHQCIYDKEAFRRRLKENFELVLKRAAQLCPAPQMIYVLNALEHVAFTLAPTLKDSAFREEAEWRLVVTVRGRDRVDFRPGQRGLTPFVRIPASAPEGLVDVTRIIIGPAQDQDLGLNAARLLLTHLGYNPSLADLSKVPYRPKGSK
jgi:hypothetical protein